MCYLKITKLVSILINVNIEIEVSGKTLEDIKTNNVDVKIYENFS